MVATYKDSRTSSLAIINIELWHLSRRPHLFQVPHKYTTYMQEVDRGIEREKKKAENETESPMSCLHMCHHNIWGKFVG